MHRRVNVPAELVAQARPNPWGKANDAAMEVLADFLEEHGDLEAATAWRGKAEDQRKGNQANKSNYHYEFENLFQKAYKKKYKEYPSNDWDEAMWSNANMYYDMGVSAAAGAKKWFKHVDKVETRRLKPVKRRYTRRKVY